MYLMPIFINRYSGMLLVLSLILFNRTTNCSEVNNDAEDSAQLYYLKSFEADNEFYKLGWLNKSIESDSSYTPSLLKKAEIYAAMGFFESSINEYTKVLAISGDDAQVLIKRAFLYYMQGKYSEAVEDANELLQGDSENAVFCFFRGIVYLKLQKYENAYDDFKHAANIDKKNFYYDYCIGFTCYLRADYNTAINYFSQSLRRFKKNSYALYFRGMSYLQTGGFEEALADFEKCQKYDRHFFYSYINAFWVYFTMQNKKMASNQLSRAERVDSLNPELFFCKALYAIGFLNDTASAMSFVNRAIFNDGNNIRYYLFRAEILSNQSDLQSVEMDYQKVLSIDSTQIPAHLGLARCYLERYDFIMCKKHVANVLHLDPDNKDAAFLRVYVSVKENSEAITLQKIELIEDYTNNTEYANILRAFHCINNNKLGEALSYFSTLEVYKNDPSIINEKSKCHFYSDDKTLAIASLKNLLNSWYSDTTTLFNLGNFYLDLYRYDSAIVYFDKVLEIDPVCLKALNGKCSALRLTERYDDALRYIDTLLTYDSTYPYAYYNRGHVFKKQKLNQNALENFSKVILYDNANKYAYYEKSDIYIKQQRYAAAISECDRALACDSTYSWAYVSKGHALALLQERQQAVRCFTKAISIDSTRSYAYFKRGEVLRLLDQDSLALKDYEKSVVLDTTRIYAYYYQAQILKDIGNKDAAVEKFNVFLTKGGTETRDSTYVREKIRELGFERNF